MADLLCRVGLDRAFAGVQRKSFYCLPARDLRQERRIGTLRLYYPPVLYCNKCIPASSTSSPSIHRFCHMDTMNHYQDARKQPSFAPANAVGDSDQVASLSSSLLPSAHDVAKAITVVALMAVVLRGLPIRSKLWNEYVTKVEMQGTGSTTEDTASAPSVHTESQTPRRPGKRRIRNRLRVARPAVRDVAVEPACAQQSQLTVHQSVLSIEVKPELPLSGLPESDVWDQCRDVGTFTYFDNAGRAYQTKAARDSAEKQRLAESLAEFPAMRLEQRLSLQRRAFARLEQVDTEQQMAVSP